MAKPNPFRQTPLDGDLPLERSSSFFADPKFEVSRGKVDFKEPLITSLPRAFSRLTRRTTAVRPSMIRRREVVSTNHKGIKLLSVLLVLLGAIWGGIEVRKKDSEPRRVARQEKKHNLRQQFLQKAANEPVRGTLRKAKVAAKKVPPVAPEAPKSFGDRMALKALALISPQEVAPPEEEKNVTPQTKPEVAAFEPQTLYVVMPLLRVRSKPALNGAIVRVLKRGDAVRAVGEEGNWYKIDENEYIGKKHLSATKLDGTVVSEEPMPLVVEEAAVTPAKPLAATPMKGAKSSEKQEAAQPATPAILALNHVAIQSVKIRGAAGPKRAVVGILRKGTIVPVYEMRGVWARIGENQFVHTGNLRPAPSQDGTPAR